MQQLGGLTGGSGAAGSKSSGNLAAKAAKALPPEERVRVEAAIEVSGEASTLACSWQHNSSILSHHSTDLNSAAHSFTAATTAGRLHLWLLRGV